jgi:hypothetical protein
MDAEIAPLIEKAAAAQKAARARDVHVFNDRAELSGVV